VRVTFNILIVSWGFEPCSTACTCRNPI